MSSEKWVKGTVAIKITRRMPSGKLEVISEEVPCIRRGVWAIHEGYRYALTHIPSGIKVTDCRLQRTAKLIADDLNHPGWNTEKGTLPHFTVLEAAKPILAKYCNQ